jgi:hypothetical protein
MANLHLLIRHGIGFSPNGERHWYQAVVTADDEGVAFKGGHCIEVRAYSRLSSPASWGGPNDPRHLGAANTAYQLKRADGYTFVPDTQYSGLSVKDVVLLIGANLGAASQQLASDALAFLRDADGGSPVPPQADVDLALASLPDALCLSVR